MMRQVGLVGMILLAACAPQIRFNVEPDNRYTFSHTGRLEAGDRLWIRVENLGRDEVFHVNRCGEPCDASKLIASHDGVDGAEFDLDLVIQEPGRYYFWILRERPGGEVGPALIFRLKAKGSGFDAGFATGATARGGVERRP